ncbi:efflux transporter outer membrane subunit [Methylotenera versatilis]|uniref:efflux transporter outer membrane subunit n=1 Tax=Methylotenera versatilis TaxID=1055487 RepID=UPI00064652D8|nr:efflux transporter outer membrane subunit [Methylotenera versatilis]
MYKYSIMLLGAIYLAGCASLAPTYSQPKAPLPSAWPEGDSYKSQNTGVLATDTSWEKFILNNKMRQVVEIGLSNNRDIKITLANIEAARAQYRVQDAAMLPTINADVTGTRGRSAVTSSNGEMSTSKVESYSASVGMTAYEIDFFGKIRSLSNAALESYLATEEAHRTAKISLISELLGAYQTMAADSSQLALSRKTMSSAESSMTVIQKRLDIGVATRLELRQAETAYQTARADVANLITLVAQDRNALELLAGTSISDDLLPAELPTNEVWFANISPSLDSSILLQRPDVLVAEHQLKSANTNIGAARAAFFPSVKLTASTGLASAELAKLFTGAGVWSLIPSVTLPIFDNGTNKANLDYANAQQKLYLATYELTLQTAFKEVADVLARNGTIKEQLDAQQHLVEAATDSYMIANERYKKGVSTYLEALDAQRVLYASEKTLITVKLLEYENHRALYKVLGGGA